MPSRGRVRFAIHISYIKLPQNLVCSTIENSREAFCFPSNLLNFPKKNTSTKNEEGFVLVSKKYIRKKSNSFPNLQQFLNQQFLKFPSAFLGKACFLFFSEQRHCSTQNRLLFGPKHAQGAAKISRVSGGLKT